MHCKNATFFRGIVNRENEPFLIPGLQGPNFRQLKQICFSLPNRQFIYRLLSDYGHWYTATKASYKFREGVVHVPVTAPQGGPRISAYLTNKPKGSCNGCFHPLGLSKEPLSRGHHYSHTHCYERLRRMAHEILELPEHHLTMRIDNWDVPFH